MFGLSKKDFITVIVLNIVWGSAFAIAGISLEYFPTLFVYSLRFFLIAIVTIPFFQIQNKKNRKKIFIMGICQALSFYGLAMGIDYLSSSVTAILSRLDTISTIVISIFVFKEKIRPQLVVGLLLCIIAMLILNSNISVKHGMWVLIICFTSICGAIVNIIAKNIKDESEATIVSWCSYYSGFILFIIAYFQEPSFALLKPLDHIAILCLLYMAVIGSFACYVTMFYLLRRNQSSRVMPYSFIRPIVAEVAGFVLLREPIHSTEVVGIVLIIIGVFLTQYRRKSDNTSDDLKNKPLSEKVKYYSNKILEK
ncbi:MAG: DMT family transporter [Rickettsiales bacterium]|jgi:drug/metabolite transporter (DMT)-like permease|nr:DMT family transporter [Rickettsiales bacterium]